MAVSWEYEKVLLKISAEPKLERGSLLVYGGLTIRCIIRYWSILIIAQIQLNWKLQ